MLVLFSGLFLAGPKLNLRFGFLPLQPPVQLHCFSPPLLAGVLLPSRLAAWRPCDWSIHTSRSVLAAAPLGAAPLKLSPSYSSEASQNSRQQRSLPPHRRKPRGAAALAPIVSMAGRSTWRGAGGQRIESMEGGRAWAYVAQSKWARNVLGGAAHSSRHKERGNECGARRAPRPRTRSTLRSGSTRSHTPRPGIQQAPHCCGSASPLVSASLRSTGCKRSRHAPRPLNAGSPEHQQREARPSPQGQAAGRHGQQGARRPASQARQPQGASGLT